MRIRTVRQAKRWLDKTGYDGYTEAIFAQAQRDAEIDLTGVLKEHGLAVAWAALWCYWTGQVQLWDDDGLYYDNNKHAFEVNGWARLRQEVEG